MTRPCECDPDDPCFCDLPTPQPRYTVRPSAKYVEQVRAISGDHRYPLRGTQP